MNRYCTEEEIRNAFTELVNDVQFLLGSGGNGIRVDIVMQKIDMCRMALVKHCQKERVEVIPRAELVRKMATEAAAAAPKNAKYEPKTGLGK